MANRTQPFGYLIADGKVRIVEDEAEIVRRIFTRYAEGFSYDDLTRWLNSQHITYHPGKQWNKNAVARILKDERYLGSDPYPPIIQAAEFTRRTPSRTGRPNEPQVKDIRTLARCSVCGEPIRRERTNTWRCPHCMVSAVPATDRQLINDVSELIRWLCGSPDIVSIPISAGEQTPGVLDAENALASEFDAAEFNESAAKAKALSLAAARFNAIGSEDYETMRIQHLLAQAEPRTELDTALLRQITPAILIHPTGEVSLKLKNGQVVERSEFP